MTAAAPLVRLEHKVAVITGAAQGQGAAEAELFVELGATVVLTDVNESAGREVAQRLGPSATFLTHDVTDSAAWQRVVRETVQQHGRVDVLVNNAGIYRKQPLASWSDADLRRLLEVNLLGPVLGMREVVDAMPDSGGAIVNVASISGMRGHGGALAYASSKWGLRGASRSAAQELAPRHVRVNCVCPGSVDTPMVDLSVLNLSHLPIPRAGTTGEVAAMVAFLASDASSYCTGADFVVDGGATA
ncbi:glucose 1-dehydrogenase [Rhodococcus sp. X156]|uniref:SDR family NAD(P)-dependent oxidoreductase n=1 Tax=Rhodococcus sp. X156 TaxID=2499145 RepID=UPI001F494FE7|nr:glucose 1-dehydrogenase [Rhodococcus sp. X156]